MYGVFLIVVLIITGGAIAFIGDRLGTKIGKKRLSIFGLRPRHTSIVITIFTGICITTLTFGVMAAASENVRTALFGMEKLNRTMQETRSALEKAQAERDATDEALNKSKADIEELQAQQDDLKLESSRLEEGNRQLEQAKNELLLKNDELNSRNSELISLNDSLGQKNVELTAKNTDLTKRNDALLSDNKWLEQKAIDLRNGLISMREGDISFRAGEVIASGVIRADRPAAEVAKDIQSLAQLANRNVAAKLGSNDDNNDIWLYQPEYDAAVETIAKSKQDMVVRIVAAGNLIRGEAIRTSLELYKNSVIYKDKEFIIARPYTLAGGTDSEAEEVVMKFLQDVNMAATSKGMLPDPITGSIGVIEGAQFYDIVNSLKGVKGPVVLSAYANGDTDALGPLRLLLSKELRPDNAVQ